MKKSFALFLAISIAYPIAAMADPFAMTNNPLRMDDTSTDVSAANAQRALDHAMKPAHANYDKEIKKKADPCGLKTYANDNYLMMKDLEAAAENGRSFDFSSAMGTVYGLRFSQDSIPIIKKEEQWWFDRWKEQEHKCVFGN